MRRSSTTTRRAQMRPPPKPHTETLRKARNKALNPTSRAELVCGADLACLIRYLLQTRRLADGVRTAAGESFAVRTTPAAPSCRSRHYDPERSSIAYACRGRRAA